MFELLVQSDNDVTGLLAYALSKQNKRDWLMAFQVAQGRDPNAEEMAAFLLGERLQSRVATYRLSAEKLLQTGEVHKPANNRVGPQPAQPILKQASTWRSIGTMLLLLVAMAVVFRLIAAWMFGTGR